MCNTPNFTGLYPDSALFNSSVLSRISAAYFFFFPGADPSGTLGLVGVAVVFCSTTVDRCKTGFQSPGNRKALQILLRSAVSMRVEHTRLELVTPTLPVLCAPSCANAPVLRKNRLSCTSRDSNPGPTD